MTVAISKQILPSAARTATFVSGPFAVERGSLKFGLDVTAASGSTPTLDIEVEHSSDGGGTWQSAGTPDDFTQAVAATQEFLTVVPRAALYRLNCVIAGGSPSFTFRVDVLEHD